MLRHLVKSAITMKASLRSFKYWIMDLKNICLMFTAAVVAQMSVFQGSK